VCVSTLWYSIRSRISPTRSIFSAVVNGDDTLLHALPARRAWPLAWAGGVAARSLREAVAYGARGRVCEVSHVMESYNNH
jgi:thiamine monophosphate synthase